MKRIARVAEALVAISILALVASVNTGWSSPPVLIRSQASPTGQELPIKVGADGTLYANISGTLTTTMGATTWSQTAVTVTSGVTAIVAPDSTLKYIQIYNGDPTGNIYVGPMSPVTAATGYKIGPGQNNAPLSPAINGLWAIGDIASNSGVIVTTGR